MNGESIVVAGCAVAAAAAVLIWIFYHYFYRLFYLSGVAHDHVTTEQRAEKLTYRLNAIRGQFQEAQHAANECREILAIGLATKLQAEANPYWKKARKQARRATESARWHARKFLDQEEVNSWVFSILRTTEIALGSCNNCHLAEGEETEPACLLLHILGKITVE